MRSLNLNLTYGYGAGSFNPEEKTDETPFWCGYSRATRQPLNFRAECVRTAQLVQAQATDLDRVPTILLSGGMDSEVVVKAFIEAQVPFRAISFRYPSNLNSHETRYIESFVRQNALQHEWYDINILRWAYSKEAKELFQRARCAFFEMVPHMKLMAFVWEQGGLPVLGNGEVLYKRNDDRTWSYVEYEYDLAWYRFEREYGVLGVMGFFQHTPEMMLSMMNEPRYRSLEHGENKTANVLLSTSRQVKYQVYTDHWPDMLVRAKHDGGEKLRQVFKPLDVQLSSMKYDDSWTSKISVLEETLTPFTAP